MSTEAIEITFEDNNMLKKIKEIFGKNIVSASGMKISIKKDILSETISLKLDNLFITKIGGIEKFTSLKALSISNNAVTDISKIKELTNLTKLELFGNNISDISSLSALVNLEYLDISRNQMNDYNKKEDESALINIEKLTNLTHLNVSHTYVFYVKGLRNLKKLTFLDLYDNGIRDISYLSELKSLIVLKLGMNNEKRSGESTLPEMQGLSALNGLTSLEELDLSYNTTPSYITYISNLLNLKKLRAEGNNIVDISGLEKLIKLQNLILYSNKIKDLKPLLNLSELTELNLMKNSMTDISYLYDSNTKKFKFPKIKKLALSTTINSASQNKDLLDYLISKVKSDKNFEFDYLYSIYDTKNLPHKDKNNISYVTYDDFGARKDGTYDDFISMKYAHTFANEYKNNNSEDCEVRGTRGSTYHIYKYYEDSVAVQTNVDWSGATFIIHDEKIEEYKGRTLRLLDISNYNSKDVKSLGAVKWKLNEKQKKIEQLKETLLPLNEKGYKTYLCKAINDNKKVYIRYGMNANSGSSLQDIFIVDSQSNILNDVQWNFDQITSFTVTPIPNGKRIVKNGKFIHKVIPIHSETPYTRANSGKAIYYSRNLNFNNCYNCYISDIIHELEEDVMSGSYTGFLTIGTGANVELRNSKIFSRIFSNSGRSTYDLNLSNVVGLKCINVTSDDIFNSRKWGITGTNFCKEIIFDKVKLNRIDAHQGIYNLNVYNSEIGSSGLTMIGQGELNLINSKVTSNSMIGLRTDYGSVWNGNMNIINTTFVPASNYKLFSYSFSFDNEKWHDFGYPVKFPKVYISNLTVDHSKYKNRHPIIIYNDKTSKSTNITDETKSYLSNADIIIDSFKFFNSTVQDNNSFISKDLIKDFNKNVFLAELNFKLNKKYDITNEMYLKNNLTFDDESSITFRINGNNYSNNSIKIYKNDELINEGKVFTNKNYEKIFEEKGNYHISVDSVDNQYLYKGKLDYYFNIDGNTGIGGFGIFMIIFSVIIVAVLGFGGFLFWKKKKKKSEDPLLNW